MSRVAVQEGVQPVHTGDERIWAIDVSAITTTPTATGTAQVFDLSSGGANVSALLVTSGTAIASGTNLILPTIGGTGWVEQHQYRIDGTFTDGSGNTYIRSIFVQVDF